MTKQNSNTKHSQAVPAGYCAAGRRLASAQPSGNSSDAVDEEVEEDDEEEEEDAEEEEEAEEAEEAAADEERVDTRLNCGDGC